MGCQFLFQRIFSTCISCIAGGFFTTESPRKPMSYLQRPYQIRTNELSTEVSQISTSTAQRLAENIHLFNKHLLRSRRYDEEQDELDPSFYQNNQAHIFIQTVLSSMEIIKQGDALEIPGMWVSWGSKIIQGSHPR